MTPRRSNYDLGMAQNYVRLALQSASQDQDAAAKVVNDILVQTPETRIRILRLATALVMLMEGTISAEACHRYSVWNYPWAQSCGSKVMRARAAAVDRSWYVEIVPTDEDLRAEAIGKLKDMLK